MEFISLDQKTVKNEHICCALSASKEARAFADAKKRWMSDAFEDRYSFIKCNENAKVFIETMPAENAWCPIVAPGWLFIDCLWVSGKYAGKGHANTLLGLAADRARQLGSAGLVALSTAKKRPFLSDPGFYRHKGFRVADTAPPDYQLLMLPLGEGVDCPWFADTVTDRVPEHGVSVWYSDHCPHTSRYLPLLEGVVASFFLPFHGHKLLTGQQARRAPNPFTSYSMYYNGAFVTNEIFSEAKMRAFLRERGANG